MYAKDDALIGRIAAVVRRARETGLRVIHVKVAFRPGVPEASPRNIFLSTVKASQPHQRFFQGNSGKLHPGTGAEPGDLIVTKSRISAFSGTDLDLLLRANDIDTLILFGIATSGAVLSTALHAADFDYRIVVLKDCCADLDGDTHACLLEKILPRVATVMSSAEWLTLR